jgi:hypothetical protein
MAGPGRPAAPTRPGAPYDAPPASPSPQRKRSRRWQAVLVGLGIFALLSVCGLTSYFIVIDEKTGNSNASATPGPSVLPRDISSRQVDPTPLTAPELFPGKVISVVPDQPGYALLTTQVAAACKAAATDDLLAALTTAGCSQVARGTLRSPDGVYLITGGIFNLVDEAAAETVRQKVKPVIDAKKGRFSGLVAGKGTEAIVRSSTHLGWDTRGHYLIYCVVARADGKDFTANDDAPVRQMIYDMIVLHLRNTVLEKRATIPAGATATPSGPAPSGPAPSANG